MKLLCVFGLFLLWAASALPLFGQATDSACTYERCALWIDGGAIRQGAAGTVVLRDGFYRPMRLRSFVGDADSAAAWATRFENSARTGYWLDGAGLLGMLVGFGAQYLRVRNRASGNDDATVLEAGLVIAGAVSLVGGAFAQRSAESRRARTIWWYNQRFAAPRSP